MKSLLKNFASFIIRLFLFPSWLLCSLFRLPKRFFLGNASKIASGSHFLVSYRTLPFPIPPARPAYRFGADQKAAIILQGPIRVQGAFTLNAVRFYKGSYPDAEVIVSTWEGEDRREIERLKESGAIVVLSQKPDNPGLLNVNLQLASSLTGVREAIKRGCFFVAKTRTDQIIRKAGLFPFLIDEIKGKPPRNGRQKGRIVTLSMNYGNLYFPYFMSDFFYFGYAEDMLAVFSQPLDRRNPFSLGRDATRYDFSATMYAPEIFILTNYLQSIGFECKCTIRDYWEAVRNALICVDIKFVDLIWTKYELARDLSWFHGDYFEDDSEEKRKTENFDYVTWENLYRGQLTYDVSMERFLQVSPKK